MINRFKSNELKEMLDHFPVLGIVGPRQVGKTTLAKLISKSLNKPSFYLDLENPRDLIKLEDPVFFLEEHQDFCVILDEIQNVPYLFSVLRSMVDQNRVPARFIVLGSVSPELIQKSSETLAGRIAFLELTPLNLIEIDESTPTLSHLFRGGFPEPFLMQSDKIRGIWYQNFIRTYLERDLPALGLKTDILLIRKLWQMLAHLHGQTLNLSVLSKSLGVAVNTISRYIGFLEGAFLIRLLQPFETNLKKRRVKAPKIYIRDSGILHQLIGVEKEKDLWGNPIVGASWEGYAIEQIIALLPNNFGFYFYRTHEGAELDLVITQANAPLIGLEFKFSSTPSLTKGSHLAAQDVKAKINYVITPSGDFYNMTPAFTTCSLGYFLKNELPKFLPFNNWM